MRNDDKIYTLRCEDICKSYKIHGSKVDVIDHFSFTFESGNLYIIKGSSGSGKSTLLSLLALIQKCDCGQIYLSDHRVDNLDEHEKQKILLDKIGIVFQDSNLLNGLSNYDNIILALTCEKRYPTEEILKRANKIIALLGIEQIRDSFPMQSSGGERQRAGIARAIINDPDILFCDEPISSLDESNANIIIRFLADYCHSENKIVIVSCHSSAFDSVADKIIQMGKA